jgi:two-component system, sensor histidine kinase and response regulator
MNNEAASRGGRILIVDDQQINLRMVAGILRPLGFELHLADDAEKALAILARESVDLILLDVLMPGRDGFDVCEEIRANATWSDIPIIFLSAANDGDLVVRALEAGGVDYITKPFHAPELVTRVRTHIALKVARDKLRQLAEDKDELLGILAHDLKNHLGGMKMTSEALQARCLKQKDAQLTALASNVQASTDQMFAFVVEFLANCAADQGWKLKREPVLIHEVSAEALRHYEVSARRKRITLAHSGEVTAPTTIDRTALNQIFHNLISNAIKFSPPDTTVRVSVETDESGSAICRVQDQGPGFNGADKAQMFRRYQRLSAQPTGDEPSTGLGLSIVKKLLQHLGAEIACESGPRGGTTFTLTFPASNPAQADGVMPSDALIA